MALSGYFDVTYRLQQRLTITTKITVAARTVDDPAPNERIISDICKRFIKHIIIILLL